MKTNRDRNIIELKKQIKKLEKKYSQIKYDIGLIQSDIPYQYPQFDKMLKEYTKSLKKSIEKITITKNNILYDYNKSINYVKNNDHSLKKSNINSLTDSNITDKELIQAQINNKKNYNKITNNIINSCQKYMNSKLTTSEFTNLITILGTDIKNQIIYETYHNPEKFIPLKEAEQSDENSSLFIKGILSKALRNNNITVAIKKEEENEKENDYEKDTFSISMIQLISTGKAFKKIITLSFDYGKKKNLQILTDEKEQTKFIKKKQKEYSIALNINEDKITLTNIRYGSLLVDLIITEEREIDLYKYLKKDREIFDITYKSLLEGCILKDNMFDKKGNRYNDNEYGKNQKRGPPNYLQDYIPPLGYLGFGLSVSGKYDNGNDTWLGYNNKEGEWYVAYHGTGNNSIPIKIIKNGFIVGERQEFSNSNNLNPLSNKLFPKCGKGIYMTPDIEEAENFSSQKDGVCLKGEYYYIVFMCRVNPHRIRFVWKDGPEYWVVGGDSIKKIKGNKNSDEIRPYRILVKKMKESNNNSFYENYFD